MQKTVVKCFQTAENAIFCAIMVIKGRKINMKSIGTVRKIDELGRIVLPIETRRNIGLEPRDGVEIYVEEDRVILKKYEPCCIFCGEADNVIYFHDKRVCRACIAALAKAAK